MNLPAPVQEILTKMFGAENSIWSDLIGLFGAQVSEIIKTYIPFVGLLFCLLLVFFGKKMLPFFKVVGFLIIGYFASMYWLIPLLDGILGKLPESAAKIAPIVIAAVIALVAACLGKFLYILLYIGAFGGGIFYLGYSGAVLPQIGGLVVKGNYIVCGIAAAVVVIVALLLRKFFEKLFTAAGGALGFVVILFTKIPAISGAYSAFVESFSKNATIGVVAPYLIYIIAGLIAILGLIAQFKGDRKYKV